MGFDPTTYALSKSAADTLSLQEKNLQAKLNMLGSILYSRQYPLESNVYGNGVIYTNERKDLPSFMRRIF